MIQNETEFEWTGTKERAANLLAQDTLSDEAIADQLRVSRATLSRWKEHPDFQARIRSNVEAMREAALSEGIADKTNRLRALNDRWQRMNRLLKIREKDTPEDVLGRETGLLVRRERATKFGAVVEFEVDTGLLAQMLAHEQQAAKELGQWTEKQEVAVNDGGILDALQRKFAESVASAGETELPLLADDGGSEGS